MSPSREEVIERFNDYVNMSADELTSWLETPESKEVGWSSATNSKHDPDDTSNESVGHASGRRIVEILTDNPRKDPSKYTDEHVEHMRKVVAYCARHLAQEGSLAERKSAEELAEAKSTKSLKNWGHDPVKATKGEQASAGKGKGKQEDEDDAGSQGKGKGKGKAAEQEPEQNDEDDDDDDEEEDAGNDREQYGRKRKRTEPYTEEELNEGVDDDDDDDEDDDFEGGDDDDDEEDAAEDSEESGSEDEDDEEDDERQEEEATSSKAPPAKKAKK